jgi:hypothetical protein
MDLHNSYIFINHTHENIALTIFFLSMTSLFLSIVMLSNQGVDGADDKGSSSLTDTNDCHDTEI